MSSLIFFDRYFIFSYRVIFVISCYFCSSNSYELRFSISLSSFLANRVMSSSYCRISLSMCLFCSSTRESCDSFCFSSIEISCCWCYCLREAIWLTYFAYSYSRAFEDLSMFIYFSIYDWIFYRWFWYSLYFLSIYNWNYISWFTICCWSCFFYSSDCLHSYCKAFSDSSFNCCINSLCLRLVSCSSFFASFF